MKKGIDVWSDHDRDGTWKLLIGKKRGKLSLPEIREAATEYEEDYYCMALPCMSDLEPISNGFDVPNNDGTTTHYDDLITMYSVQDVWKQ